MGCHSGSFASGVLNLESYDLVMNGGSNNGPVVIPFNADSSLLHRVLLPVPVIVPNEPICCRMPKDGDPLTLEQQNTIFDWINEGALRSSSLSVVSVPKLWHANLEVSPNPFNSSVRISFLSENIRQKEIIIYDMMGVKIRSIKLERTIEGKNFIFWDGRNDLGRTTSSGVYFINLCQDTKPLGSQKIIFLK